MYLELTSVSALEGEALVRPPLKPDAERKFVAESCPPGNLLILTAWLFLCMFRGEYASIHLPRNLLNLIMCFLVAILTLIAQSSVKSQKKYCKIPAVKLK